MTQFKYKHNFEIIFIKQWYHMLYIHKLGENSIFVHWPCHHYKRVYHQSITFFFFFFFSKRFSCQGFQSWRICHINVEQTRPHILWLKEFTGQQIGSYIYIKAEFCLRESLNSATWHEPAFEKKKKNWTGSPFCTAFYLKCQ